MVSGDPEDPPGPPRKRRRPALSCCECRRRKIKCDRGFPCGQCTRLGIPNCTFIQPRPDDASTRPVIPPSDLGDSVGYGTAIPSGRNSDSLSYNWPTPVSSPTTSTNIDAIQGRASALTERHLPSERRQVQQADKEDTVQHMKRRIHELEQTISDLKDRKGDPAVGVSLSAQPQAGIDTSCKKSVRGFCSKGRLFGQSHWLHSFEQFEKIRAIAETPDWNDTASLLAGSTLTSEIAGLLVKCKSLSRAVKPSDPEPTVNLPELRSTIPSREIADKLVDLFYRLQIGRIIHVPTFQEEYNQYWETMEIRDTGFLVKLVLIMAIATYFCPDLDEIDQLRPVARKWVCLATSWISTPSEKSRLNITGLQVHCLHHLARQINAVGGDLVWISAGSMFRKAILMGLHRDPKHFPRMSPLIGEVRRRLWYTILEYNLQSCLDTGMPPMVTLDDFDTELPANINDDEISETTSEPPSSRPMNVYTETSITRILSKLLPLRYKIVSLINDFSKDPLYEDVICLSRDLIAGIREANALLDTYQTNPGEDKHYCPFSGFQRDLVSHLLHRFLMALHRPFAYKARTDPRYYYSRKICTETALEIISPEGRGSSEPDFRRLLLTGSGVFRDVVAHATMTLCLELITQLEEDTSNLTLDPNRGNREPIRQAINKVIALTEKRVQHGETNVKCHTFLMMAMGQIEAMETGQTTPDLAIVAAAKKSVETTYDLLRTWLKPSTPNPSTSSTLDPSESPTGSGTDTTRRTTNTSSSSIQDTNSNNNAHQTTSPGAASQNASSSSYSTNTFTNAISQPDPTLSFGLSPIPAMSDGMDDFDIVANSWLWPLDWQEETSWD